jgi:HSP20 family protein
MNTMKKTGESRAGGQTRTVAPAVDVLEGREAFLVVADLPGVQKDDLKIELHDSELTVVGKRTSTASGTLLAGRGTEHEFRRTFTLPGGIDADRIDAHLEGGVLTVTLPKQGALKPRQIMVRAG